MPDFCLYVVGSLPPEASTELKRGLMERSDTSSPVRVAGWQPFQPLTPSQSELPYIVLLVGSNRTYDQEEYLAVSGALALHQSGQAVLIPVILQRDKLLPDQQSAAITNPWAKRCRDQMGRVMQLDPVILAETEPWYRGLAPAVWDAVRKAPRPVPVPSHVVGPVTVFFSYSHRDEALRDELARHLKLLERTGLIKGWHDRQIVPGDDWAGEIDQHLYTADLILLLLSSDFFASDYCYEIEVPVAVARHKRNAARAIPVVLRPVIWHESALAAFQALPADGKPVTTWEPMDSAFVNVCEGILSSVLAWKDRRSPEAAGAADDHGSFSRFFSTRKRMLDAALPAEVEVGKSVMLVVLVRTAASGGLRALVAGDSGYGLAMEDVQSRHITLQFPLNEAKKPESIALTVRVQSPEFSPPQQEKRLMVQPDGDSQPCILMLAANRAGQLTVAVELYNGDQLITACPIRCLAITTPVAEGARCNIASSGFEVDEGATREGERVETVVTGDAKRGAGEFTQPFKLPAPDVGSPAPQSSIPIQSDPIESPPEPVTGEFPSYSPSAASPVPARSSRRLGLIMGMVLLLAVIALGYLMVRLLR